MFKDEKKEIIGDTETITGKFRKNKEYEQLSRMIKKSKDIPKNDKKIILDNLIDEDITRKYLGDGRKYKYLYSTAMFNRAYDIYTSSLLAFLFHNWASVHILIRAQFENMCTNSYYLKNPTKLKNSFTELVSQREARKYMAECVEDVDPNTNFDRQYFGKVYDELSQKSHPFPEGFKIYFGSINQIVFKEDGGVVSVPLLNVKSHHTDIDSETKKLILKNIYIPFMAIDAQLNELVKLDINDEISDYSEIQKAYSLGRDIGN